VPPPKNARSRVRWAAGAARLLLSEPGEGLDRVRVRARRLWGGPPLGALAYHYDSDPDWERHLHDRLRLACPCPAAEEFARLWPEIQRDVEERGLAVGRGTYGGWDDADPGFARAVWCLCRHLRPSKVVETGVARGITSRVVLEALDRNGEGQLWSVDLPALDLALHEQIGAAVPDRLRRRWTYVRGTSRKKLPALLSKLGTIDLFIHDSSHTRRNVSFELRCSWSRIERGAVVVDDIDRNEGFERFTRSVAAGASLVAAADDERALFGIALKGAQDPTGPARRLVLGSVVERGEARQKPRFTAR
jgi:hypothetical protein